MTLHPGPNPTTYSLISFSLSKGLLGFLDVLLSESGKARISRCARDQAVRRRAPLPVLGVSLTVRVLDRHLEGLIFGL